ncbi:hypothetical protein A2U01_0099671, partial [Trifolium medium]|nr:hypothetical protein [Trifolium medium]
FMQPAGSEGRSSHGEDVEIPSRSVVEATKLIRIEEEVGLVFHGAEGEDLGRTVVMEGRDHAEKEG